MFSSRHAEGSGSRESVRIALTDMARLIPHSSQAFEIFLVKWSIYEILTKINRVEPQLRSFFQQPPLTTARHNTIDRLVWPPIQQKFVYAVFLPILQRTYSRNPIPTLIRSATEYAALSKFLTFITLVSCHHRQHPRLVYQLVFRQMVFTPTR